MLTAPKTGQILQNKDVNLRLELRQGSETGSAVWGEDYATQTDERGMCNLSLSLSEDIDWNAGPYYMTLLLDGEEIGTSPMTAVPYALQAASIDGVITRKELIGTWEAYRAEKETFTYTFLEDGTGTYTTAYNNSENVTNITWSLNSVGCIYLKMYSEKSEDWNHESYSIFKVSDNEIAIGDKVSVLFKKVTE